MPTFIRVLAIGFAVVILLLAVAAAIGVINARSSGRNAAGLVSDQLVISRLLDDVEREQEVLNTVFYRLSRTPEIVDRERVLADLDQTDRDVEDMSNQVSAGPGQDAWEGLETAMGEFSAEARRLLSQKNVGPDSTRDLFIRHEQV